MAPRRRIGMPVYVVAQGRIGKDAFAGGANALTAGAAAAAGAVLEGLVYAAGGGIAGVGGAQVVIVAIFGFAHGAVAAQAGLLAVAGVAVGAGSAVQDRIVDAPQGRIAVIDGADVAICAVQRLASSALPVLAHLGAVAQVIIRAFVPVGCRGAGTVAGEVARLANTVARSGAAHPVHAITREALGAAVTGRTGNSTDEVGDEAFELVHLGAAPSKR